MSQFETDPIVELLDKLYLPQWTAAPFTLAAPWGFQVPPGRVCLYVIMQGGGWYQCDATDQPPIRLTVGDHLIATRGRAHRLSHRVGDSARPVDVLMEESKWMAQQATDTNSTVILYAQFQLDGLTRNPLDFGLPDTVHLNHQRDQDLATCLPILDLVQLTRRQASRGWQLMIRRLAELVLIHTLSVELSRSMTCEGGSGPYRLTQAVTDASIGPVLKALVDKPEQPWSVPAMASMAKVSKSVFSERFRNLVGQPPLQYLTEIRMQKACRLLRDSGVEIANIATLVGYESPSSFSNAFKRWNGSSPAEYRRGKERSA